MPASVAVRACCTVAQETTVKVLVKSGEYLSPEHSILGLETLRPGTLKFVSPVVHDTVESTFLRLPALIMLQLLLGFIPAAVTA